MFAPVCIRKRAQPNLNAKAAGRRTTPQNESECAIKTLKEEEERQIRKGATRGSSTQWQGFLLVPPHSSSICLGG
jgi:hypothetical protein